MPQKILDRRSIIKGAALGATTAVATFPTPAISQETFQWKMVTTWPKNFPGLGTGAQRIADTITEMSDGRLTVKLYAAGELVPAFEAFDAVREGKAEMTHDAAYYWVAKHKAFPFFCTVRIDSVEGIALSANIDGAEVADSRRRKRSIINSMLPLIGTILIDCM